MVHILKKDSTETLAGKAAEQADNARITLLCGREHCNDPKWGFGGDYYGSAIRELEDALKLAKAAYAKAQLENSKKRTGFNANTPRSKERGTFCDTTQNTR